VDILQAVKRLLLLLSVILPHFASAAADHPLFFQSIGTRDGLSHSTVNSIVRDNDGFMWFATQDGLNRFDGYSFKVFRTKPEDTSSLSHNYIWRMIKSRSGELWIGTFDGGLNRYDPKTGRFSHFLPLKDDSSSLRSRNVSAIHEDRFGTLWVGTWFGGLSRLDSSGKGFTHFLHLANDSTSLSDNRVGSVLMARNGDLWVGTWNGLNRMAHGTSSFIRYFADKRNSNSLGGNMIWDMSEDHDGTIWIATWGGGISRYDPGTNRFVSYVHTAAATSISSNLLRCVSIDSKNNVWVGTYDAGLNLYDRPTGTFQRYQHVNNNPASLPDDEVQSVYEDYSGVLWVGTGAGIGSFDQRRRKFLQIRFAQNDSKVGTRSLAPDRDNGIWIATVGSGLYYMAPGDLHPKLFQKTIGGRVFPQSQLVTRVLVTSDAMLWVGTRNAGLSRLDLHSNRFETFGTKGKGFIALPHNDITSLFQDSHGIVWVGTNGGGLTSIDYDARATRSFQYSPDDSTTISGNSVWAITEDSHGDLWVGTWGASLNRFDRRSERFVRYKHHPGDSTTVPGNTIYCFAEVGPKDLWIGTSGGLAHYDSESDQFTSFTEADGLVNNSVYGILPDDHGSFWLSTARGLARFIPASRSFTSYDESDGLLSDDFDQGVYCKRSDGVMIFGNTSGLIAFHPDSLQENKRIPTVVITRFLVYQNPRQPTRGEDNHLSVVLDYTENFFSFEFAALDFAVPEKNEYVFKLQGLDPDWVSAGKRRFANYTHVSPGTYLFTVRGSNNDGVWNLEGASMTVTILPPYWETWWFRTLVILVLALAIYASYRYRVKRILEVEHLRRRISQDLHDDVGTNLSAIILASQVMEQRYTLPSEATSQLDDIKSVATKTQDLMRDIVWMLNPGNDSTELFFSRMRHEANRLLRNIAFEFNAPDADLPPSIDLHRKRNIFLIYKESLNNIVRHSRATKVIVIATIQDSHLSMTITDNGIGFDSSQASGGSGLASISNRAMRIGGNLSISSYPGKGTEVRFHMKIA